MQFCMHMIYSYILYGRNISSGPAALRLHFPGLEYLHVFVGVFYPFVLMLLEDLICKTTQGPASVSLQFTFFSSSFLHNVHPHSPTCIARPVALWWF